MEEKECEWDRKQTADEEVSEDDYLFRQSNGKADESKHVFTFRFKKILKQNGLPSELNLHSLRHTNASLLIAQGVDVRTVASLLGHSQASTTLDIYAHAFDKNKRKAQENSERCLGYERNGRKIKLTRANKIILIIALGDYYYQQRAMNTGWQETGYLILKVDSLPSR